MDANDFQKGCDYGKTRVSGDDGLQWVRNIIDWLWDEDKIETEECARLLESLSKKRDENDR